MLEIFSYDFVVRAFLAGTAAAVLTGVIGNFVVANRQAVAADMLAHISLAGVGLAVFWNFSPIAGAIWICLAGAALLWLLQRQRSLAPEAVSVLLMTGGLAIALLFSHLAKDKPVSFETYLFGSILTISSSELILFSSLALAALILISLLWKRLFVTALDPDFARSRFDRTDLIELVFLLLVGLVVAISLKIIGGLLISAMLVIPVLSAQNLCRSFGSAVLISIFLNILGVAGGIMASFYLDVPTSSAIVISLIVLFVLSAFSKAQK